MQAKPKLLHSMREKLRLRRFSPRTEQAYLGWVRRYVRFHGMRHPGGLGLAEVRGFLGHLADRSQAAASTLNQARAALAFLYGEVLETGLAFGSIPRPRRPARIPVVLTRREVALVLGRLQGQNWLVGTLLYGGGLRLLECLSLRVKDVDLERGELRIRRAKGGKDRVTVLPAIAREPLRRHLERVRALHARDLESGDGGGRVELPGGLARKYPSAAAEWPWQ